MHFSINNEQYNGNWETIKNTFIIIILLLSFCFLIPYELSFLINIEP